MMPRPADRASAVESGVISSPLTTDYLAGRVRAEGCEPAARPRASTRSEGRPASPAPRGPPLGGWSPWPDAAAGAPELPARARARRGTHVLRQPRAERPGYPQEAGHPVTGGRCLQPALHRPFLPGDDGLVAEQADPRVVRGVAARRGLQHVTAGDADLMGLDRGDCVLELAASPVAGHRPAVPVKLVGSHAVHAVTGRQALGGELDVPTADRRADVRLVGGLVLAEPDVAVRPEDLRLAELGRQLLQQFGHRLQDLRVIGLLVLGPVGLRIVGRQPFVELQGFVWPPAE